MPQARGKFLAGMGGREQILCAWNVPSKGREMRCFGCIRKTRAGSGKGETRTLTGGGEGTGRMGMSLAGIVVGKRERRPLGEVFFPEEGGGCSVGAVKRVDVGKKKFKEGEDRTFNSDDRGGVIAVRGTTHRLSHEVRKKRPRSSAKGISQPERSDVGGEKGESSIWEREDMRDLISAPSNRARLKFISKITQRGSKGSISHGRGGTKSI